MIEVVAVAGLATVQDRGRPGRMHEGVPPGGALAPMLLARANVAARNALDEAGIEVVGRVTLLAAADVTLADDEGHARALRAGQTWTLACREERVRYAAVRGGLDVPVVLGGRGTLVVAALGGFEGRPLRAGDLLRVGRSLERESVMPPAPCLDDPVRVVPGPDLDRFVPSALEVLLTSAYRISPKSDRVGVRLSGPALQRADHDDGVSAPMVQGAIQVPASGEPIVLGPDHPTTGGYPVIATVMAADAGRLMACPVGARVTFTLPLK